MENQKKAFSGKKNKNQSVLVVQKKINKKKKKFLKELCRGEFSFGYQRANQQKDL